MSSTVLEGVRGDSSALSGRPYVRGQDTDCHQSGRKVPGTGSVLPPDAVIPGAGWRRSSGSTRPTDWGRTRWALGDLSHTGIGHLGRFIAQNRIRPIGVAGNFGGVWSWRTHVADVAARCGCSELHPSVHLYLWMKFAGSRPPTQHLVFIRRRKIARRRPAISPSRKGSQPRLRLHGDVWSSAKLQIQGIVRNFAGDRREQVLRLTVGLAHLRDYVQRLRNSIVWHHWVNLGIIIVKVSSKRVAKTLPAVSCSCTQDLLLVFLLPLFRRATF